MEEAKDKGVNQKERRDWKTADFKTIIDYQAHGQTGKTNITIMKNLNMLKLNDS